MRRLAQILDAAFISPPRDVLDDVALELAKIVCGDIVPWLHCPCNVMGSSDLSIARALDHASLIFRHSNSSACSAASLANRNASAAAFQSRKHAAASAVDNALRAAIRCSE
jgi:hypothetical protein